MERLTYFENGHWRLKINGVVYSEWDFVDRLAAYEDTGLTPGEVASLWAEWDAMMSVLNSIGGYDRLRELAEADKEGRVVVLPDKIETVVQPVQVSTDDLARFQGNAQANDVGHCKTCKHCHEERGNFCDYHAASVCPNWFCWGWEWKGGDKNG